MAPDLDLSHRIWTFRRLGVTAIGTWIRVEGRFRPCMVLIPADREYDDRLTPCVVTMDRAWIWSEEVGDPPQAAATAMQFARCLGFNENDRRFVMRLAMFIADHLGDLLSIPPYSNSNVETVAEVTMTDASTGRIIETELKE
jgi:hypothetical protein